MGFQSLRGPNKNSDYLMLSRLDDSITISKVNGARKETDFEAIPSDCQVIFLCLLLFTAILLAFTYSY